MGLYLRSASVAEAGNTITIQGTSLAYNQADNNFVYLLTNMSGSNIRITGSTGIIGNTVITGSLSVSSTVFATASWATNVLTASYVTGSTFTSANPALSASYALSSSQATSASYVLSASYATTALSADAFTVRGNLIASGNITLGDATTDTITLNAATMSLAGSVFQIISGSNTLATLNNIGKFAVTSGSGSGYKSITLDPSGSRINYFLEGSYNTYIDFSNGDFTYINNSGNKNFIAGANNITADVLSSGLNTSYAALTLKSTWYGVSTTTPAINFTVYKTDGGNNNLSKLQIYNGDDGNVILLPHLPVSGGYVGIGTTTPSSSLHVSGAARIDDVLVLPFKTSLPSGKPTGSIALSGSGGTFEGMYVYNGTSWTKVGP